MTRLSRCPRIGARSRVAPLALLLAALAVLAGCGAPSTAVSADGHDPLTLVLPWYADPEGGGFFAAQTEGLYRDNKLDVTLQPGGPQVSATQLVATGRAQVGFTDAAGIVSARAQGIPVVAIGALYQDNPVGVMVHADTGITSFAQMAGLTWVVQAGQLGPDWVRRTTGVAFQTQQYQGSIANFLNDDRLVQQGWPTNEAYQAKQAGIGVTFIPFSSSGFNPYNDVFFTSESYLSSHRDQLRRFLAASMQGWQDYLGKLPVAEAANQALLAANNQQTPQSVWYAWDKQRPYVIAGDGATKLGAMTAQRWSTFLDQMQRLGQLGQRPALTELFDDSLLSAIGAPAQLPPPPAGSY
ncbi:MAG TPA: ABC transporter substrate-binding protein [Pseudonocardia sp.]|nr:ABC transporter substrate-binding protein [Pseudonocardia sp.]